MEDIQGYLNIVHHYTRAYTGGARGAVALPRPVRNSELS